MSKVVFVGNVPYKISEDALIDVFKSVGQVVAFRLVFDRETGKPKGYGFCEFADHATALSAVRNLNNTDVGGRSLRIDLADSDPFLEGKTTVRGEIIDGGTPGPAENRWRGGHEQEGTEILVAVPPGKPLLPGQRAEDVITQFMREQKSGQLDEILAQMKAFSFTHPKQAIAFIQHNPQVAYAIYKGLSLSGIIPPDSLQNLAIQPGHSRGPGQQPPPPARYPTPQQSVFPPQPSYNGYPPAPPRPPSQPPLAPMYGHPGMPPQPTPPPPGYGAYYGRPMPPPPPPQHIPSHIPAQYPPPPQQPQGQGLLQSLQNNPEQQHALSIVMNLTAAQLNALSPEDRATVEQLRGGMLGR
ncbi:hypothetical protein C8F01DRAFT_1148566 [Mycena amicta]|nr:hypothetical protein C8F01DRAFT_1148566 [Mycena amicta]